MAGPLLLTRQPAAPYVPLRVRSCYSFLDATLTPAAVVALAQRYECPAVALVDLGNLHGAVAFTEAAQQAGIQPILGVELQVEGAPLILYVESARGYANLCQLLSEDGPEFATASTAAPPCPDPGKDDPFTDALSAGHTVAARQRRNRTRKELEGFTEGLIAVAADPRWADLFPGRFYLAAAGSARTTIPDGKPRLLCPPVHYATPEEQELHLILQAIRTRTLLRQPHPEKHFGRRWHFRSPAEMELLGRGHAHWRALGREIAERCRFVLPGDGPSFPRMPLRTAAHRAPFCGDWWKRDCNGDTVGAVPAPRTAGT
ncbi:MAG: hypothetical protein KatS3mg132_368 [Limisphaera sp.]|nr:MAG: hypothetical protein KatS3mg132_368 [Limisphaera sp.]